MQLSERQTQILDFLNLKGGTLSSQEITERLNVSVQTIRKDLNELDELGLVKRVHGGITQPTQRQNLSFSKRQIINLEEKQKIALDVAAFLPKDSSVFLGIGTTPEQIAQALIPHPGLTVITNNLNATLALCQNPNIEILMVGGRVRHQDQDVVGEEATNFFRRYQVNYGIVGVGGIGAQGHLLDFSLEESHLTQTILNNSDHTLLVADHYKYLRSAPVKSGHLQQIDKFFTDTIDSELLDLCLENSVSVKMTEPQARASKPEKTEGEDA